MAPAPEDQAVSAAARAYAIARLESLAVWLLAGNAAARRCLRGSQPGWRRMRTMLEILAHHEAGHAVARRCHGDYVWHLSIIPDKTVRIEKNGISGGFCLGGFTPEPLTPIERPARAETDLHQVAAICLILSEDESAPVRPAIRAAHRLKARARDLVEKEWPLIARLAAELVEHRELGRFEIERILKGSRSNGRG